MDIVNWWSLVRLTKSDKDTISAAIKRLRQELADFTFIRIVSNRGNGYQLMINHPELTEINQSIQTEIDNSIQ